jgi:hypothetical protein
MTEFYGPLSLVFAFAFYIRRNIRILPNAAYGFFGRHNNSDSLD